jgi:simple sugar transport system substrate-binding protein
LQHKEKTPIKGEKVMLKKLVFLFVVASLALTACGGGAAPAEEAAAPASDAPFGSASCAPNCTYADMVLCYPQLGAESDWRTANSASFKETAETLGVKLFL